MTLTEFLTARIAEDEAVTFELQPYDCPPGCCAPEGWVGHRCLICATPTEYGGTVNAISEVAREHEERVHQRARVLAECQAKRRIVELHTRTEPYEHECAGDYTGYSVTNPELSPCLTLLLLALPYDDHPDYRDEWRL